MLKNWFKHNFYASIDPRMRMLKKKLGYAGVGIYWEIVEYIESCRGIYPRNALYSMICTKRITRRIVDEVLDDFFLFETNEEGRVCLSDIVAGECDKEYLKELMMAKAAEICSEETTEPSNSEEKGAQKITGDTPDCGREMTGDTPNCGQKTAGYPVSQGARVKNRREENRLDDDDDLRVACATLPSSPSSPTPAQSTPDAPPKASWMKHVEPLRQENTSWQETVCMKSGYGNLLRRRWQQAIDEFVKHIIEHDQGFSIHTSHDARYYFASYARQTVRSGQKLKDTLQQADDHDNAERQSQDPYRYEQLIDGNRYANGCPIPAEAPPRPTSTAVWNEATGEWSEAI